ncbi:MAG: 6-bladed beta-propeller [bacterium]|nr:6-bladed beta-propeller [bacterium]
MRRILFVLLMVTLSIGLLARADRVANPDTPQKGTWDFKLQEVWKVDSAGKDVLGNVGVIEVGEDGRVYIMDTKNCKIYIFDKSGTFVSAFGKKGEGPGEIKDFRMGTGLFVVGDSLIVTERGRIHYFSLDGVYKKSVPLTGPLEPRAFVSDNLFVSAPLLNMMQNDSGTKIKLYNIEDGSETLISQYKTYKKAASAKESGGRRMMVGIIIGGLTPLMTVAYNDGKVYYGMSDSYNISVVDYKGKNKRSFGIDGRSRKQVTAAFKKELGQNFKNIPQEMVKNIMNGLPDKACFFATINVSKSGMVYVSRADPGNNSSRDFDIFSPAGKYLYTAKIKQPGGGDIGNYFFSDGAIYIVGEDEDGNVLVTKYALNEPVAS